MTPTFASPNAAFFAYERSLMRPRRWPPTQHDAPTLWLRAKAMLDVAVATVTSIASLVTRACFSRRERRELVARLAPVEKLVRMLMLTEAATFLLMTPQGRRLREQTPVIDTSVIDPPAPPSPPQPALTATTTGSTRILMPGWQTIAAFRPYIDPRVVEREQREQREALARRIAGLESITQDRPEDAADDPENWRCRFRVLRWVHDRANDDPRARPWLPANRPRLATFDASAFPITSGMAITPAAPPDTDDAPLAPGRNLARRIEALSRILANPAPAIRRLARRLAALPADALPEPCMAGVATRHWHHGVPENWNAHSLAAPAFRALAWLADRSARKHDPG